MRYAICSPSWDEKYLLQQVFFSIRSANYTVQPSWQQYQRSTKLLLCHSPDENDEIRLGVGTAQAEGDRRPHNTRLLDGNSADPAAGWHAAQAGGQSSRRCSSRTAGTRTQPCDCRATPQTYTRSWSEPRNACARYLSPIRYRIRPARGETGDDADDGPGTFCPPLRVPRLESELSQLYGTRSPANKSELQMQLSVCNCICICLSYHYRKYEFLIQGW